MIKNYFKIAIRNLNRNKGYSLINILGLSVGLACSILVFLYVQNELSYDRFHENKDRLYRVVKERQGGNNISRSVWSQVPMGPVIEEEFPQVEHAIRFWSAFQPLVGNGQDVYNEDEQLYFTDSEVFQSFSFHLVRGNPDEVLVQPGSVVLSQKAAAKYFGKEDPIGRSLTYRGYPAGDLTLTVTGIMENLPPNTQFDFDLLVSMNGVETEASNWGSHKPIWTYLLLQEGTNERQLEEQLPSFLDSRYESSTVTRKVELEPLEKVHLYSGYRGGFKAGSSVTYLYLFGAVGFLILGIACINFINLATARSIDRATEVGVRKTFGAYRWQLVKQFIGETFLLVLISQILGLLLVELALPVFNSLAGKSLELTFLNNTPLWASLILLTVFVSLGAGLYPAFVLSGFKPVTVLRNRSVSKGKGVGLRRFLVAFQFSISIALIIATGVVIKQLDYIQNKQLGFDEERVIVLPYSENEGPLINRLQQHPDIAEISVSQRVPVNTMNTDGRTMELPGLEEPIRVESFIIDDNFLETYDIEVVAGRGISEEMASDTSAFLINETAVREFGWTSPEEALGKSAMWSGYKKGTIVGVVRDFHLASFHESIEPMVLHIMPDSQWWRTFISVRARAAAELSGMLQFLESTWKQYSPHGAYSYFFIDQSLEELHRADQRLATVFGYISGVAIFIACLGLLGLVSFMTAQRSKEIAIRKVLGATVSQILLLFNKKFLVLVAAGFAVAVPVSIYLMGLWLSEFAYRVDVGSEVIIFAGLAVLIIAGLTVSGQSIRAALMNPVKSLRNE